MVVQHKITAGKIYKMEGEMQHGSWVDTAHSSHSLFSYSFLTEIRGKKNILYVQVGLGCQHSCFGHILCTGQTVECSMSCSKLDRLLNQAMSTYMKYMLPFGLLAVTF